MKITHIYHSGFMVTMENSILLFDWYKRSLPEIPTDQKLYVFCSHAHEDHYSPQIWDLQKTFKDVTYILDEGIADAAEHPEADVIIVRPRQTYTIPADGSGPASLKVITLESTDMGVAFYIETEGKRIYHAGDLNVWFWNDEPVRRCSIWRTASVKTIRKLTVPVRTACRSFSTPHLFLLITGWKNMRRAAWLPSWKFSVLNTFSPCITGGKKPRSGST